MSPNLLELVLKKTSSVIYRNYINIGGFIILTVNLILLATDSIPPDYRIPLILIIFFIIILYIYKVYIQNEKPDKKPKDPGAPVTEHLEYRDVEFAIYCLTKKIVESEFLIKDADGKYDAKKNIIIGIDRGGAIVGGMLAKNLGLAIKTLAIYYAKPPLVDGGKETSICAGQCLENIELSSDTKILLVDDAIRTGDTMAAAKRKLNQIMDQRNLTGQCLFSWNEVPGNDTDKFIDYLVKNYSVNWVKNTKIDKIDNNKTINVYSENNSLSLKLNNEKTKAILIIDNDKGDEFIVKAEQDKLNIHEQMFKVACILFQNQNRARIRLPTFFAYRTKISERWLPWDLMHWPPDNMELEQNKIREFEKLCKGKKYNELKRFSFRK